MRSRRIVERNREAFGRRVTRLADEGVQRMQFSQVVMAGVSMWDPNVVVTTIRLGAQSREVRVSELDCRYVGELQARVARTAEHLANDWAREEALKGR